MCFVESMLWHMGQKWNRDRNWGAQPSRLPRPASRRALSGCFPFGETPNGAREVFADGQACAPQNAIPTSFVSNRLDMVSTKHVSKFKVGRSSRPTLNLKLTYA